MHWPSRRVALCERDMMSDWMVESETANRGSKGGEKRKKKEKKDRGRGQQPDRSARGIIHEMTRGNIQR